MLEGLLSNSADFAAICAMSLMEFAHGTVRLPPMEAKRQRAEGFMEDIRLALPVIPVTDEFAVRVGRVDGQLRKADLTIGVVDVVIAATALEMSFAVATFNVKHFASVPHLEVFEL